MRFNNKFSEYSENIKEEVIMEKRKGKKHEEAKRLYAKSKVNYFGN